MNMDPDSPYSPSDSASFSEVPTEPLNSSDRQMMNEYMSRRQHFLSDYERYNPVQNMHMLANHVFDLSENIFRLKNDVTSSRRMLDLVSSNQRECNDSVREVGEDLGLARGDIELVRGDIDVIRGDMVTTRDDVHVLRRDVAVLKQEMDDMRRETQQGIAELKNMIAMLVQVRA